MKFFPARLSKFAIYTLFLMGCTAAAVMAGAQAEQSGETAHVEEAAPVTGDGSSGACITGPAALDDLKAQRGRVEAREKALVAREQELKALEKGLQDEFKKLEQLRGEMVKSEELKKKENEEKVAKIVETVETMSPKSASQLLGTLDETLAVTAIQRMATPKLAKILNVMEPGRSSRLTELLAGVARAQGSNLASNGASQATQSPNPGGKGGDGNDRKTE